MRWVIRLVAAEPGHRPALYLSGTSSGPTGFSADYGIWNATRFPSLEAAERILKAVQPSKSAWPSAAAVAVMATEVVTRACARCGEGFIPRRRQAMYCRGACKTASFRDRQRLSGSGSSAPRSGGRQGL